MARKILPILEHPTNFKILICLSNKDNNSFGIGKILSRSHAGIYRQLHNSTLVSEKYIISKDKGKFALNIIKIKKEYLNFIYENNKKLPNMNTILKNKYFNFIFDKSFNELYKIVNEIDNKTNLHNYFIVLTNIIKHSIFDLIILGDAILEIINNDKIDHISVLSENITELYQDHLKDMNKELFIFYSFANNIKVASTPLNKIKSPIFNQFKDLTKNEINECKNTFISKLEKN